MSAPVALITGAGRGIGRAVAVELSLRAHALLLVARTESDLRATAKLTNAAQIFATDVVKPQAAGDAVRNCLQRYGRLDAVVHCAGLAPILKIADVRTDKRIEFVGGARGTRELQARVDRGQSAVAFSLHPVGVADLMAVSDEGAIMPPKSTWFEPKLRDGLLIHTI